MSQPPIISRGQEHSPGAYGSWTSRWRRSWRIRSVWWCKTWPFVLWCRWSTPDKYHCAYPWSKPGSIATRFSICWLIHCVLHRRPECSRGTSSHCRSQSIHSYSRAWSGTSKPFLCSRLLSSGWRTPSLALCACRTLRIHRHLRSTVLGFLVFCAAESLAEPWRLIAARRHLWPSLARIKRPFLNPLY